ncbi:19 kDa globulin [Dichanthelium oligosanthes]|uniref:19 kDa globulin n=1 Tax=Dichanthelium oligosanthes TaxID=888268 RepID=A0A1E5VKG9_9POAL|nr:19 kDa globulin [Dichanthelium oligosanthes]
MAKFVTVAAAALCLAALVAVAVGQSEFERQRLRDLRCQREVEESPLDACRQVLDRQLTGGMRYGIGPFRWGTGLRMRCCQQLQDVSRECRCSAIRRMVRGYEVETMPPPEGGYGGGESAGEEGYYGEGSQQGEGCRCGQAGEGCRRQQRYLPFPVGPGRKIARVRLTKERQYAAGLPMMCRLEPQECSVFSGDQYI